MKKVWYIYKIDQDIGMNSNKDKIFTIMETLANRKWNKTDDIATKDKIVIGMYEARLEDVK